MPVPKKRRRKRWSHSLNLGKEVMKVGILLKSLAALRAKRIFKRKDYDLCDHRILGYYFVAAAISFE